MNMAIWKIYFVDIVYPHAKIISSFPNMYPLGVALGRSGNTWLGTDTRFLNELTNMV
jgi:hypothetical protein